MRKITYQQPVKQKAREFLWEYAVRILTSKRETAQVLNKEFIAALWNYAFDDVLVKYGLYKKPQKTLLKSWENFADTVYGKKHPRDLRIAYFSGPEPENDLEVLLKLGVIPENIWAIESDGATYKTALSRLHDKFPTLKLFHGSLESFIDIHPIPFDVFYLDSTKPFFARDGGIFKTIHHLLERQALTEIGILIINSATPAPTKESIDFLTRYFYPQEWVEGAVFNKKTDSGEPITWPIEGPTMVPIDPDALSTIISNNWDASYSAFCTHYPMLYANLCIPAYRILTGNSAKRQLFTSDTSKIQKNISKASDVSWLMDMLGDTEEILTPPTETAGEKLDAFGGDLITTPTDFPFSCFLMGLGDLDNALAKHWTDLFSQRHSGTSRCDAILMCDLLRRVQEGYFPVLSETLLEALPRIHAAIPDNKGGIFCDTPTIGLWVETAMNQLGFPYHSQINAHRRIKYCAKATTMMADVFVFDRCRAFYDWLPMLDLYSTDLLNVERQIIARSCLHAIHRQIRWLVPQLYKYSSLAPYYDKTVKWNTFGELLPRTLLH